MNDNFFSIQSSIRQECEISRKTIGEGLTLTEFLFHFDETEADKEERWIKIRYSFPILGITGQWYPTCGTDRTLKADWCTDIESMMSISAPVISFFGSDDNNVRTIAFSEVSQRLRMNFGVHEEDGTMRCKVFFQIPRGLYPKEYHICLWEDQRKIPFFLSLNEVRKWWEEENKSCHIPDVARDPLYSFWYSYHQGINEEIVERECKKAAEYGFSTVIVDDGWQTSDTGRGFGYAGDWEYTTDKFPDFPAHIKRVQNMGLKYIAWFSVAYVGRYSKAWDRFRDKILYYDEFQKAGILDIRYREIREYLKKAFNRAVTLWGLDGLKLDFIDEFYLRKDSTPFQEPMDIADVQEALECLLSDLMKEVLACRPELLIEFRQRYIGPKIRAYGNMLRVSDCPASDLSNRLGTIDLRLLSGNTAVHSDMLMWNKEESPEDAARQIISCLFSTVQISVPLTDIKTEMEEMLLFWIDFMKEHQQLLLKNQIEPVEPANLYPACSTTDGETRITVHYSSNRMWNIDAEMDRNMLVNGSRKQKQFIYIAAPGNYTFVVRDCRGRMVSETIVEVEGVGKTLFLDLPASGMITSIRR